MNRETVLSAWNDLCEPHDERPPGRLLVEFSERVEAAERERLRGGHDLDAMCEAFHRLIEAHAQSNSPFHQPVVSDAQMALRVLRGLAQGFRA